MIKLKQSKAAHACNPIIGKLRQENHKFKVSLTYTMCSRLASATKWGLWKGRQGRGSMKRSLGESKGGRKGEEKVEKQELTHSVIPNLLSEPTLILSQNRIQSSHTRAQLLKVLPLFNVSTSDQIYSTLTFGRWVIPKEARCVTLITHFNCTLVSLPTRLD